MAIFTKIISIMNTVRKGDLFEGKAYQIVDTAVKEGRLGLNPEFCHLEQKASFYSKDREGNIIFDIGIKVIPPGANQCHLLYLIECKDYSGPIPVSDVEEFIAKIQQVAGLYVKGVLITTTDLQEGGYNLLKNKNMMWIKVDADSHDIRLFNKKRKSAEQSDLPVVSLNEELRKLQEIKTLFVNEEIDISSNDWDLIIEHFLSRELNAKVNWEQPGDKTEGLEYRSKTIIKGISEKILIDFNPNVVSRGNPLPLDDFMDYITRVHGLRFFVNVPFEGNKSHLNGFYQRKDKTIHINPELQGTGQFAFVCMHEISHFLLHEDLKISQTVYDQQEDSKYDQATQKHKLEKEKHWIEWQANYLAACLLMPKYSLMFQLVKWQIGEGIRNYGSIWVDNQPCNIRDYKVVITQLAYIFQVSRSILEIRMRDLEMIKYQKKRSYNSFSLFGESRKTRFVGNIMKSWMDKYLSDAEEWDGQ